MSNNDNLSDIWGMRARGKRDSERHKERLKKAVKDSLKEIITQEDIISTDNSGRKIKIPMKYLDRWHFKNGKNKKNHGVGHGGQDLKPGQVIAGDEEEKSNQAGDDKGAMIYEEFDLEDIIDMMMEDLNLPWLEDKPEKSEIETETDAYIDLSKKGLMPNLDIRRTLKENIKRNATKGKAVIGNFNQDDLRFKTYDIKKEYRSNASITLIMDRSGSMDYNKKYIAKSFFFWMVQFIKKKYKHVELVFIFHDVEAYICNENDFFNISEGGGTKCSSGFALALEHIIEHYPIDSWNNYVFAMSDGDNFTEDNVKCVSIVDKLLEVVNAIGYGEIVLGEGMSAFYSNTADRELSTLQSIFNKTIVSEKFISVSINKKEDVYKCLQQFFSTQDSTIKK